MSGDFLELDEIFRMLRERKGGQQAQPKKEVRQQPPPPPSFRNENVIDLTKKDEFRKHSHLAKMEDKGSFVEPHLREVSTIKDVKAEHTSFKPIEDIIESHEYREQKARVDSGNIADELRNMKNNDWRKAMVLMEIIGPPVSLRENS